MGISAKWQQVKQLRRLPNSEKRIVVATAIGLPCTIVGLRLFGFKRWYAGLSWWAHRWQWGQIAADESRSVQRTLQLMGLALRYALHRGNCLSQSLTLWWLLQSQGIKSDLRIGVRRVEGQFQAHAWIEHDGQPINDMQDVQSRFATFQRAIPVDMGAFVAVKENVE
jgi:hypothetical protein